MKLLYNAHNYEGGKAPVSVNTSVYLVDNKLYFTIFYRDELSDTTSKMTFTEKYDRRTVKDLDTYIQVLINANFKRKIPPFRYGHKTNHLIEIMTNG